MIGDMGKALVFFNVKFSVFTIESEFESSDPFFGYNLWQES